MDKIWQDFFRGVVAFGGTLDIHESLDIKIFKVHDQRQLEEALKITPGKTNITMEQQPFEVEDVSPI